MKKKSKITDPQTEFEDALDRIDVDAIVSLLNDYGKEIDPRVHEKTIMGAAAKTGKVALVEALLKWRGPEGERLGADAVNYALRKSAHYNHPQLLELLLHDPRADPADKDNYAIRQASYSGHVEVVRLLLDDSRVNPTIFNNEAISNAIPHPRIVQLLLGWSGRHGEKVNPADRNNDDIQNACLNGYTETTYLLLKDARVDPTANNNFCIRMAAYWGYTEIVRLLLNWVGPNGKRVDPTVKNNYAIRKATKMERMDVVRLLMHWYEGKYMNLMFDGKAKEAKELIREIKDIPLVKEIAEERAATSWAIRKRLLASKDIRNYISSMQGGYKLQKEKKVYCKYCHH